MKKQMAFPVSMYHAGVNPEYCFFVLPVNESSALVIDSKYMELVKKAIIPILMNSKLKINLNEIDYCSASVCFFVFTPNLVNIVAMMILMNTAIVTLKKNIAN